MASGPMTTQKPRRPTAFEVSFPNEHSGDDDDEEEDDDERDHDVQNSRQGKRKHDSTARSDGRVRLTLVSPPFCTTHPVWEM